MVLFNKPVQLKGCDKWMYAGQDGFQKFLVVVAVICIPWMLLAKPITLMRNAKKKHYQVCICITIIIQCYI